MIKEILNKTLFVFLLLSSIILVFLSRKFQIDFIKEFSHIFYVFKDPIFTNPDAYHFLSKIKEQLITDTHLIEKLTSQDLLTSIYIILFNFSQNISLPELVLLSSPYMVLFPFLSIFLFFRSITNNNLGLLTAFLYLISDIFLGRSYALFFDTDVLNIFFTFLILFLINFYFEKKLTRKNYYIVSILIIFFNFLFIFHYPQTLFSFFNLIIISFIFFFISQKKIDKLIILFLFVLSTFLSYGGIKIFEAASVVFNAYSDAEYIDEKSLLSVVSTVIELKVYSFFEIEEMLFYFNFYGFAFLLSFLGIFLFLKENVLKIFLFLPFFIFLYLTFTKGIRFTIFVAPFTYFGFFYFIFFMINKFRIYYKVNIFLLDKFLLLISILIIWQISSVSCFKFVSRICLQKYSMQPYFGTKIVKGIIKFNNIKSNYNIISSLDYGYLIDYYTNSHFEMTPSDALKKNKYRFFYSDLNISNENIKKEFGIKNDYENYIFLTNDFIKWWPTISLLYSKAGDKIPQILQFDCDEKIKGNLECSSEKGLKTKINLIEGTIDEDKKIFKLIINSKKNYDTQILNKEGSVIIVYSPSLEKSNLTAIFPKRFENLFFIKYFFSKINNSKIKLIDDSWPNYRTYKIK